MLHDQLGPTMTDQAMARPDCEHHWVSHHQPGLPIYWIDQCSSCGEFNPECLREQIAKLEADAAQAALNAAADGMIEMGDIWGGNAMWLTTGTHVATLVAEVLRQDAAEAGGQR